MAERPASDPPKRGVRPPEARARAFGTKLVRALSSSAGFARAQRDVLRLGVIAVAHRRGFASREGIEVALERGRSDALEELTPIAEDLGVRLGPKGDACVLDARSRRIVRALLDDTELASLGPEALGHLYEGVLEAGQGDARPTRQARGAHYTPRALAERVVQRALEARLGDRLVSREAIEALSVCDPAMGAGAFLLAAVRTLSRAAVAAEGACAGDPDSRLAEATRRIASSSVYGVDADPTAVELARIALWLEIGDPALPLEATGIGLVHGDALLGGPVRPERAVSQMTLDFEAGGHALARLRREALRETDPERRVSLVRRVRRLVPAPSDQGAAPPLAFAEAFPEVFDGSGRGGFDLCLGNPPFLGGKRIVTVLGAEVRRALSERYPDSSRNTDLAAYFLRRCYELCAPGGVLGLVTTNTIAQGDTRAGGLAKVLTEGGVIVDAERRVSWGGDATVVASTVVIARPPLAEAVTPRLDGAPVERISAYLDRAALDAEPPRQAACRDVAFVGCFLRGMGFTFDDTSPHAIPLAVRDELIAREPRFAERIRPYLGGDELGHSPTQSAHRSVIDLFGLDEEAARAHYPELLALVEQKVRPNRARLGDSLADRGHRLRWWRFANERPRLRQAMQGLEHVIVVPRVSARPVFARVPADQVFSEQVVVFASERFDLFALLSSRVHLTWARAHSSTLGDGLRYNPTDCFESFPLPFDMQLASERHAATDAGLDALGRELCAVRADVLTELGEGLAPLGARLDDPADQHPGVVALRALAERIDRELLDRYGFDDLAVPATFVPGVRVGLRLDLPAPVRHELIARLRRRAFGE